MKKTTLYGVTAIISLLATFVLRHFWIAAGSGGRFLLYNGSGCVARQHIPRKPARGGHRIKQGGMEKCFHA